MIYWLFTDGRDGLIAMLVPLVCSTPILLLVTATMMGAGIRRTSDERAKPSALRRGMLIVTYALILLTITTLYLTFLGDQAVQRGRSNANGVIELLVGAPPGIHTMRLFLFGMMLAFVLMVTVIGLHSLLRNGGWLREKIDRLRSPSVKRGVLGSSHFCTLREYRRFRRADPEGLILLGAFWGEQKRRLDVGTGQFCLGGEDVARGILTLGGPGSGKTQGIILPAIADRMLSGHSLVVADPQGEITAHILKYAAVTRHLVV
ncbi:MAG: type IV secretory system conjugative DNA transfer family protein, partial [Chloroflexota bacterium]